MECDVYPGDVWSYTWSDGRSTVVAVLSATRRNNVFNCYVTPITQYAGETGYEIWDFSAMGRWVLLSRMTSDGDTDGTS